MEIYKIFEAIRKSNLEARKRNDYLTLMVNAQALLDYVPQLIEIMVNEEHEYRKFEAKLSQTKDENGKYYSNSYCETQSKATTNYKEYIKAKATLDWVYDSVNLSKKLATSVDQEMTAQTK